MPKSLRFDGVVKADGRYHIKHGEGEEIVQCETDAEFAQWCKDRLSETTPVALSAFLVAALRSGAGDLAAINKHKGKTITLDMGGGDMTSARAQIRVK